MFRIFEFNLIFKFKSHLTFHRFTEYKYDLLFITKLEI